MKKSKLIWIFVIIIVVAAIFFLWRKKSVRIVKSTNGTASQQDGEQTTGQDESSLADQSDNSGNSNQDVDYNAICQNGDWITISNISGDLTTASGKLRRVYPDNPQSSQFKDYLYYLEGSPSYGLNGPDLSKLDPFEDRQVEVKGAKSQDGKEIAVSQIHCSGQETDKNSIDNRTKILDFVAANLPSIAPHPAKYKQWTVDTVSFVDNNNVYVEYYDSAEDQDNWKGSEDTSRKILVEMSPKDSGGYDTKVLAYWEMGADDYALKEGTDKFGSNTDLISFQFDPEKKSWERIN